MAINKEQVIQEVARKAGRDIAVDAKLEKGVWRVTLTKGEKFLSAWRRSAFLAG